MSSTTKLVALGASVVPIHEETANDVTRNGPSVPPSTTVGVQLPTTTWSVEPAPLNASAGGHVGASWFPGSTPVARGSSVVRLENVAATRLVDAPSAEVPSENAITFESSLVAKMLGTELVLTVAAFASDELQTVSVDAPVARLTFDQRNTTSWTTFATIPFSAAASVASSSVTAAPPAAGMAFTASPCW